MAGILALTQFKMAFNYFKALHLFGAISWCAAIFYLPRLFVYHAQAQGERDQSSMARLKVMEERLFYMGLIAMAICFTFGLAMLANPIGAALMKSARWLSVKLTLVFLLFVYYMYCWNLQLTFAADENQRSPKFYRYFNEISTLIVLAIVILAIVRPF